MVGANYRAVRYGV